MSIERLDLQGIPQSVQRQDLFDVLPRSTVGTLGTDELADRLAARPDVTPDDVLHELLIAAHAATGTWEPTAEQIDDATAEIEGAVLDAMQPESVRHGRLERDVPIDNDDFGATDTVFVETLLAGLPPNQADVVRARIFDDLSFSGVGDQLSMTRSNAQSVFTTALRALTRGVKGKAEQPHDGGWDDEQAKAIDQALRHHSLRLRRGTNAVNRDAHGKLDALASTTADNLDDICTRGIGRQINRMRDDPSHVQGSVRRLVHDQGAISHGKTMRAMGYGPDDPLTTDQ